MNRNLPSFVLRTSCLVLAFAALAANAGVKYWDNPAFRAFDVGDYVTNGLVLHYDGIRNAGADAEHSTTSDTWVNLAPGGGYDLGRFFWSKTGPDSKPWVRTNGSGSGAWNKDNGFVFDGKGGFVSTETLTIRPTYTLQLAMTATAAAQNVSENNGSTGYLFRPNPKTPSGSATWENCSVCIRNTANGSTTDANAIYTVETARFGNSTTRPQFSNASPRYATVLGTTNALACFEGTAVPSSGKGYRTGTINTDLTSAWFAIGAQQDGSPRASNALQAFIGTLHSFRFYDGSLTEEQLAWNRVVDEARFFGGRAPIPVTNIVVATTAEGAEGDQPCGAYALDSDGFTFTAPAHRTVKGCRYLLNGYTVEAWNGSGWDPATTHDGDSYDAASSGMVRLTWRYERPAGEGRLVVYDESDYVTDGLVLHYDGIRNQGIGRPHSMDATTWVNLAPGGAYPLAWCSYVKHADNKFWPDRNAPSNGTWVANGFRFDGKSLFATENNISFSLPETYTMQFVMTAKASDQYSPSYLLRPQSDWRRGAVAINPTANAANGTPANAVYVVDTNRFESGSIRPNFANANPRYATILGDSAALRCFEGTAIPGTSATDGSYKANAANRSAYTHSWLSFGSQYYPGGTGNDNHSNLQSFKGTLHSIRYYDRALTEAELEKNRRVDDYRFFGILPATNVFVQSTYSYLEGYEKCGGYEVEDSYTFTAPENVTVEVNGTEIDYACDGYILERRSGRVGWELVGSYESRSYRYEVSAGTVRLTWKWKATRGLRTAADYRFDDYSPAGLRLHYDGLLNQGVGAERSTTANKWANLGSDGSAMDLRLNRNALDDNRSAWGEQGYDFAGHAMFYSDSIEWTTNSFTAQAFVDAAFEDNAAEAGNYIAATAWARLGLQIWGFNGKDSARLNALGEWYMDPRPAFGSETGGLQFLTAIQNDASRTTTIFPGIDIPALGDAVRRYTACSNEYSSAFRLGGWGGGTSSDQCLVGTVKNFRYYDRVLTEEELVRNRNVDSARYFGELGVTNLVVEIEEGETMTVTPAPGAYFVEGSYDFSVQTRGSDVRFSYKLQRWDEENGRWAYVRSGQGTEYTHVVADAVAPKMKLTWRQQQPFIVIVR